MPAPIRPMPIIPISTLGTASSLVPLPSPLRLRCRCPALPFLTPAAEGRGHRLGEEVERPRAVQADADDPAALGLERLGVAGRLRRDQGPEGVLASRHLRVTDGTVDELDEAAGVGAALVVLAGRVLEPRPEAQRGGRPGGVADAGARA